MSLGGAPDPDAFTLDRVGRGAGGGRQATTLERREGSVWREVARYPDRATAAQALDELIARGGSPTDHRLVSPDRTGVQGLLLIGAAILVVTFGVSLWQIYR